MSRSCFGKDLFGSDQGGYSRYRIVPWAGRENNGEFILNEITPLLRVQLHVHPSPGPAVTPTAPPHPTPHSGTLKLTLDLNQNRFRPGDSFRLGLHINNGSDRTYLSHVVAVLLDIQGVYFWYPEWRGEFDGMIRDIRPGREYIPILSFDFPAVTSAGDAAFYAACLNPEITGIIGDLDWVPFVWAL